MPLPWPGTTASLVILILLLHYSHAIPRPVPEEDWFEKLENEKKALIAIFNPPLSQKMKAAEGSLPNCRDVDGLRPCADPWHILCCRRHVDAQLRKSKQARRDRSIVRAFGKLVEHGADPGIFADVEEAVKLAVRDYRANGNFGIYCERPLSVESWNGTCPDIRYYPMICHDEDIIFPNSKIMMGVDCETPTSEERPLGGWIPATEPPFNPQVHPGTLTSLMPGYMAVLAVILPILGPYGGPIAAALILELGTLVALGLNMWEDKSDNNGFHDDESPGDLVVWE